MEVQYIKINNKRGSKFYFKDPEMTILHREDGPAREWVNGNKEWWLNGKLHREDGPAIEMGGGSKVWFINDEELTEEEFKRCTAPEIVLTLDEIAAKLGIEVSKLKIKK